MSKIIGCGLCASEDYIKQGYTEIDRAMPFDDYTLEMKLEDDRRLSAYIVNNDTMDPVAEVSLEQCNYCPMCGRRLFTKTQRINTRYMWKKKKEV